MGFFSKVPKVTDAFDPAKMKSIVSMAISRLELQKSGKSNQVKMQQRSIAELLQAGKYDAARIRAERCITEERSLDGYEALKILLEIISTRIQVIADSKSVPLLGNSGTSPNAMCPPELKEAVTSVIWASTVLGDSVGELIKLRKMFENKYGKGFINMSVSNSDLSVNTVLLERFSISPNPQEKCVAYLCQIAEKFSVEDFDATQLKEDPNNIAVVLGSVPVMVNKNEPGAIQTPSGMLIPPMTCVQDDLDARLDFLRLS